MIDPIEDADIVALLIKEKNRGENTSNIVRRALRFYAHQEFLNQHEYFVERQANLNNNMIAKDTSGYSNIDTSEQENKSTSEFVAKDTNSANNKPKPKITKIKAENTMIMSWIIKPRIQASLMFSFTLPLVVNATGGFVSLDICIFVA